MLFDSTAIAIGLYASYMAAKPPTNKHPFGLHKFETISGYINAIFLTIAIVKALFSSIFFMFTKNEDCN